MSFVGVFPDIITAPITILCFFTKCEPEVKIDPDDYYIDSRTGLRRLNVDTTRLSSDGEDQVRAITSTRDGHEKYCKFRGIGAHYSWYSRTTGPKNWCFGPRKENLCCENQGNCRCDFKAKYQCYCD